MAQLRIATRRVQARPALAINASPLNSFRHDGVADMPRGLGTVQTDRFHADLLTKQQLHLLFQRALHRHQMKCSSAVLVVAEIIVGRHHPGRAHDLIGLDPGAVGMVGVHQTLGPREDIARLDRLLCLRARARRTQDFASSSTACCCFPDWNVRALTKCRSRQLRSKFD